MGGGEGVKVLGANGRVGKKIGKVLAVEEGMDKFPERFWEREE